MASVPEAHAQAGSVTVSPASGSDPAVREPGSSGMVSFTISHVAQDLETRTFFLSCAGSNASCVSYPSSVTLDPGAPQAPIRITTTAPYLETVERWLGLDTAGRITAHLNCPNADLGRFFQFDPLGRLIEGKDLQQR